MAGKNENRFFKILLAHLETLDPVPSIEEVASYLGVSETSFRAYFATPGKQAQEPFHVSTIRQLYLGYKIPYKQFLLNEEELQNLATPDEDIMEKFRKDRYYFDPQQIISKYSPIIQDICDFSDLDYSTNMPPTRANSFINNYAAKLAKFICLAEERFLVYESLGRLLETKMVYLEHYGKAHEEIFTYIESRVSDGALPVYSRFLALPYTSHKSKVFTAFEQAAIYMLQHCSVPLFEHICRCFVIDLATNKDRKAKFYVIPIPVRPYHFGLIDHKITLSEYSRYSSSGGGLLPSLLWIESHAENPVEDNGVNLFEIYQHDLNQLLVQYGDWFFKSRQEFIALVEKAGSMEFLSVDEQPLRTSQHRIASMMKVKQEKMLQIFEL